jgi:4-alpha-glucanotransferase
MRITFNIQYKTFPGQNLQICGSLPELGSWDTNLSLQMNYGSGDNWSAVAELPEGVAVFEYKYVVFNADGYALWEWGRNRKFDASDFIVDEVILRENWRSPSNEEKVMFSSAFSDAIMRPSADLKPVKARGKKTLQFKIQVPRIGKGYRVCVLGNDIKLGKWNLKEPLLLGCGEDFPDWKGSVNLTGVGLPIHYKYGIYDLSKKEVVTIEEGVDREVSSLPEGDEFALAVSDESFRYPLGNWKGAGVAVPVFSLRSDKSFGSGDFGDLIDFIDWADETGMKMLQILPVNETIASHNWLDSYPYKSISVMALHPIYMNIDKLGTLPTEEERKEFEEARNRLNKVSHVDYPEVLKYKSRFFKRMFDQQKETLFDQDDYKAFFEKNNNWLVPYAAFVYLRDRKKSPNFREWGEFSSYDEALIKSMSKPGSEAWDDIAVHYFIQYHLDKQLKEVTAYAREKGIVLKGDIPIGISPNSVEAWTEPHLFHLDAQAGAPPDDFAMKGQNWGFPTYNWEQMTAEGFKWWIDRLQKMADYFDAYRIDHILGFFRIWEIPVHAVEGILGYFNPAMPMSAEEIGHFGVSFDYERMVRPYIRYHFLHNIFGDFTDEVIEKYLEGTTWGAFKMKEAFDTQQKVNQHFLHGIEEEELPEKDRWIRDGLFDLIANVLFIQTGHDQWHPRISMHMTSSYAELDEQTRNNLNQLYTHYFYKRHDDFWYHKGMEKLPAIIAASHMLVCGEDLGMVPDCVPPVMDQLNILSLEIQRMSKNPKVRFAHPADAPYLSVCTTSTHDMPTIRGWWEQDRATTQMFYNNELGNLGDAPFFAEPWVCQQIITQHIHSPAMWTTFPIQDLLSMDGELRWHETQEEQINHPSNVRHKWRYRMHQSIEDLKNAHEFNRKLKVLVDESGRSSDY